MLVRQHTIEIFNAAVEAVQPVRLLPKYISVSSDSLVIFDKKFPLNALPGIYVIGAGKAAAAMASTLEAVIGSYITDGLVVTKYDHALPLLKIKCLEAAHPVPDENGIAATSATIKLLKTTKPGDIILCLLSGGASSLWSDLPPGVTLHELQELVSLLLKSGATIDEMNVVRKHLSSVKGGGILKFAPGAHWFSFIISDVPGDKLDAIASGPTVADTSNFADAKFIVDKYILGDKIPASIIKHISDGITGKIPETLKKGDALLLQVCNKIIGSNTIALKAAAAKAKQLGYEVPFIDDALSGEAATVGREFTRSCKKYSAKKPACFLLGGETIVTVDGDGKGGRNQHMALSALIEMGRNNEPAFNNKITFLAAGTDGTDGPTDAAGAIADETMLATAATLKITPAEYLENFDAYHFFEKVQGFFKTGATQTNVMDLVIVIVA